MSDDTKFPRVISLESDDGKALLIDTFGLLKEIEALRRERDEWKAKAEQQTAQREEWRNAAVERGKQCHEYMNACHDLQAQLAIAVEALTEVCKWWDRAHPVGRDPLAIARETLAKLEEAGHE